MGKGSNIYTIKIYCVKCQNLLYKYQKEGHGLLVNVIKTELSRIIPMVT